MSGDTSSDGSEKDGSTIARTVKFVVFSGIAFSVIKSINPFNRRKTIIGNDDLTTAPSQCTDAFTLSSSSQTNAVTATDVGLNGSGKIQPITQLDAQHIPKIIQLDAQQVTEHIPKITQLDAQQVTEAIPKTIQSQASPVTAIDVNLNGSAKTQPQPITELDAQRVTEAIPKTIQKQNGPKNGHIAPIITIDIRPGDTLWGLSKKHGVSIDAIKQANGLSGDTIIVGKKLIIP